jgi:predicted permease
VFALGGALWVLKVTLIAANHLSGRDVDSFGVPVLYVAAVILLAVGATAVGAALLRRHRWWAQLLAAAVAIPALIFLYEAIDTVLKGLFGDVGPAWLADELGIVATGALCLVGGALVGRAVGMPRRDALAA